MTESTEVSARSDVGNVRKVNEDSYVATMPVFLVADGMGGHARGDKASQAVARVFGERIRENSLPTPDAVLETIREANDAVRALSSGDEVGIAVAGTTLSGVIQVQDAGAADRKWMVVNVGDSRVYGWDGRTLTQLSVDHSAIQELLDAGVLSLDEAHAHPDRNVITRAIGAEDTVDVDVWLLPAGGRQTFVICSDGLCKEVDDDSIARLLAERPGGGSEAGGLASALVDAALEAGGRDNVTVIVVESQIGDSADDGSADDDGPTTDRVDSTPEYLEDTHPRNQVASDGDTSSAGLRVQEQRDQEQRGQEKWGQEQ